MAPFANLHVLLLRDLLLHVLLLLRLLLLLRHVRRSHGIRHQGLEKGERINRTCRLSRAQRQRR